jgi:hypothetical protein
MSGEAIGIRIGREIAGITARDTVEQSLPHLSERERKGLLSHYVGVTTWEKIVGECGLPPRLLDDA